MTALQRTLHRERAPSRRRPRRHGHRPPERIAKRLLAALACLLFATAAAAQARLADGADPAERLQRATQLLDRLDAGDWNRAGEHFSAAMQDALAAEQLQQVWTALPRQLGPALGRGAARHERSGPFEVVVVPLRHQSATLDARVTFDADGRIAGFHVVPAAPPPPPAATGKDGFTEQPLAVGEGVGALPGTLALPRDAARVPAAVLVHGSGPHDRDETIGPNRPFLDLARGLARRGVAVLRYEKRSHARPQEFASATYTVDTETVDDAVQAVAAVAAHPRVDPARVYVLGHSLGAMMAPRIAQRAPVAGLVLLAAPARPLEDVLLEQVRFLAALEDAVSSEAQAQIAAIEAGVAQVKALGARPDAERLLLDLPVAYWRDLAGYDPVAALEALPQPALVVHAGRDIQVGQADWARWRGAFDDSPRVSLRSFPALNHLMIAGEGPGTPKEYFQPGQVDASLIDAIAAWIHSHSAAHRPRNP